MKVFSDPEVDSLFALKISTFSTSPLDLAVLRPRQSEEAFGRISHNFYVKKDSDLDVDSESTCEELIRWRRRRGWGWWWWCVCVCELLLCGVAR